MFGSGNLPGPLQDKHQYHMLVAKLRQKADRESQQQEALKDSRLSQHTSKTSMEPEHTRLIESTGGYVSPQPPRIPTRPKR